jgi:ribonuclease Z
VHPRLAVYTHIVLLSTDPAVPPPTLQDLERVTKTYQGRFEIGQDLMRVGVGDSIVVTRHAQ